MTFHARSVTRFIEALHDNDKPAFNQAYWDACTAETVPMSLINGVLDAFCVPNCDRAAARDQATQLLDAYISDLASGRAKPLTPHPTL